MRGALTLNTPSFSLSSPFTPVSCSIFAVSSFTSAARVGDTAPARAKYANAANALRSEERIIFVQKFFSILNSFQFASTEAYCSLFRDHRRLLRYLTLSIGRSGLLQSEN